MTKSSISRNNPCDCLYYEFDEGLVFARFQRFRRRSDFCWVIICLRRGSDLC